MRCVTCPLPRLAVSVPQECAGVGAQLAQDLTDPVVSAFSSFHESCGLSRGKARTGGAASRLTVDRSAHSFHTRTSRYWLVSSSQSGFLIGKCYQNHQN